MSFKQLNDLRPEELKQHARQVVSEARHAVARAEAGVAVAAAAVEATPMDAREDIKAAVAALLAAKETEVAARAAMDRAWEASMRACEAASCWRIAASNAQPRASAIANLDILHRQQIMGDWSDDINEAYIQDRIYETRPDVIKAKKDKEAQMNSMLGDWDKAGKLIKRHTSKNRKKTNRRRQKIAKRIKGTKRRK